MTEDYGKLKNKSSYTPIIIAAGVALLLFGIVIYLPLVIAGAVVIGAAVFKLFKDGAKKNLLNQRISEEKWPLESVSKEKLGMWVFLISEILIFGSLIVAYAYVRVTSGSWPVATQTHNVILGMTNTIILLTSSLAMIFALYSIRAGNIKGLKIGLVSAFVLGACFSRDQAWS